MEMMNKVRHFFLLIRDNTGYNKATIPSCPISTPMLNDSREIIIPSLGNPVSLNAEENPKP